MHRRSHATPQGTEEGAQEAGGRVELSFMKKQVHTVSEFLKFPVL